MRKVLCFAFCLTFLMSMLTVVPHQAVYAEQGVTYYVSVTGDDSNDGSFDAPFATIQKARDTIRSLNGNLPEGGVVVRIMGGTYPVSDTISFTAKDSGTKDCPIVYEAYNGEKVSFIGGVTLDSSKMQKVTDSLLLDRLIEEEAKDHLYLLNLREQGIEMDALAPYGWSNGSYRPKRIYMNNNLLTEARWPNDDQSQLLIKCRPLTAADGIDEDSINTTKTPIMYEYPDPENRSEKWTLKEGDTYIGGAIVYFWASENLLIDELDTENKIVTSLTPSSYAAVKNVGWGPQYKVYFSNIFEEIDKPGESYIDREKGILYFYPIGVTDNANLVVSTLKKNMLNLNGVSYLSFKGIDFKETVETPVVMTNCNHILIENGEISNTSAGGMSIKNCTNTVVRGCNFYTTGITAITLSGGDRVQLTPSGNIIENNLFHNTNLLPSSRQSRSVISMNGCAGDVIQYNEFNDIGYGALDIIASNDIVFQYNRVLNAEQNSSDAGVVYWGREIDTLGNVVRYNYFENVGSDLIYHYLNGGTACSFFADDGSTGGDVYGNVFLNGGTNQAVVGNGPQFSRIHHNISICTELNKMTRSFQMRNWAPSTGLSNVYGVTLPKKANIGTWLYLMGMRQPFGGTISAPTQSDLNLMWSEAWKTKYQNTLWEGALNQYSQTKYTEAKALFDAQDYAGLLTYLTANLPDELSNDIYENVSIGRTKMDSLANHYRNYNGSEGTISAEDKALFVDFDGKDFTLTAEGLAKIKTVAPEFEAIPFREIGLKTNVGGNKPAVTVDSNVITTGVAVPGIAISPAYTFTDADGDLEGNTRIYWYVSDTRDGTFEKIYSKEGKSFSVTEEYVNRYLKYEIIPYDTTVLRGEATWSEPILVEESGACDVTYQVGEQGTLWKNEAEVSENEVLVSGTYSYQVLPEEGYEVDSVTVTSGDVTLPITLNANSEFDVTIVRDTTITVSFREIVKTPTIVTDSTILPDTVTEGETDYRAYLAFATISAVKEIDGYGMYLNFPGGQIKLEGLTDEATMKLMTESNGKFAFRVYGKALTGKTVTLLPYIIMDDVETIGEETEELSYQ